MKISWAAWTRAFREASPHQSSWINIQTGDAKRFNPRKLGADRVAELEEALYDEEGWVEIPYAESDDEYQDMRAFATSPECGRAGRDLIMGLADEKPFRSFRVALKNHKPAKAAWFENRRKEAELRLVAFCRAFEIALKHPEYLKRVAEVEAAELEEDGAFDEDGEFEEDGAFDEDPGSAEDGPQDRMAELITHVDGNSESGGD
ncbi:MAG: hypothetical protein ACI9OJ_002534 [Myxococcota bacterium]|jgi:hypothetical protein